MPRRFLEPRQASGVSSLGDLTMATTEAKQMPIIVGDLKLTPEVIEALTNLQDEFGDEECVSMFAENVMFIAAIDNEKWAISKDIFGLFVDVLKLLNALSKRHERLRTSEDVNYR